MLRDTGPHRFDNRGTSVILNEAHLLRYGAIVTVPVVLPTATQLGIPALATTMDVYGLIGDPVEHSWSPAMFEAAFDAAEVDARYATFPVEADRLKAAIDGASALGIRGLNVTIPHKATVLEHADPTAAAASVGAANVIDYDTEPPTADNTDILAMAAVIERIDRPAGSALVLGAGGAARAYVHALATAGWTVTIANRTTARATALAAEYPRTEGIGLEEGVTRVSSADLVLNATPVGLQSDESLLVPDRFHADQVVVDAVYRPAVTRLLEDAAAAGAETVSGLTLLLEQAVATFEVWRDEPAPRAAMATALEDASAR